MATTKTIQSVERAFSILELFQNNRDELSLKEISEQLSLNKSTAFGLVNTLVTLGYLFQNEENQKYSLGIKILSLTNTVKTSNILVRFSRPYLEILSNKYCETVHSAMEMNNGILYLDKVEAASSIYINAQTSAKNHMHCTAVGKMILAYKNNYELEDFLSEPLKKITSNTITNADTFKTEMAVIRERGCAFDNEELEVGLSCVAVPILMAHNKAGFVISISGTTARMEKHKKDGLIEDLIHTSEMLSQIIYGYMD